MNVLLENIKYFFSKVLPSAEKKCQWNEEAVQTALSAAKSCEDFFLWLLMLVQGIVNAAEILSKNLK